MADYIALPFPVFPVTMTTHKRREVEWNFTDFEFDEGVSRQSK